MAFVGDVDHFLGDDWGDLREGRVDDFEDCAAVVERAVKCYGMYHFSTW